MTQSVTIPTTATELTLQALRGVCDDPSDTVHVSLDGNDIGTVVCDGTDGGFVEYSFSVAGYNDGGSHSLVIGGTVGGTNGTPPESGHSNIFVDDVVIEDNVNIPAQPSSCSRIIEDLSCNVAPVGYDQGIASSWTVIDNENTGVVWTDINSAFAGGFVNPGNYTGGDGEAATVSSDAFISTEYDTELRSNSINLSTANSASLNYQANYFNWFGDFLDLDVSVDGGNVWVNLLSWGETHGGYEGPGEAVTIDLAAYLGEPDVQLRWHYYNPNFGDWDFYAQIDDVSLTCDLSGRMHGHGEIKGVDKTKYKHKVDLQCADGAGPNKLEIDWNSHKSGKSGKSDKSNKSKKSGKSGKGKNRFVLTELTSAACSEQPGLAGNGSFNTIVGAGVGTLNGEPASIEFRFVDGGKNADEAEYTITGLDGVSVSGKLSHGDHHTH